MLPKGTSLDKVTDEKIKEVEDWINNMPMKVLNYLTPQEKMTSILSGRQESTSGALQDRM